MARRITCCTNMFRVRLRSLPSAEEDGGKPTPYGAVSTLLKVSGSTPRLINGVAAAPLGCDCPSVAQLRSGRRRPDTNRGSSADSVQVSH
jgi:hypothetical protein